MRRSPSYFFLASFLSLAASPIRAAITTDKELLQAICNLKVSQIFSVFETLSRWLLIMGLPLAVIFLGFGGYLLISSAGNEERRRKGKKMLYWAGIGIALIILARALVLTTGFFLGADLSLVGAPPDIAPPRNCP